MVVKYSLRPVYWVTQKLPQIYTANHTTFPLHIRKVTVHICGNFWVIQYQAYWDYEKTIRIHYFKQKSDTDPDFKNQNPDPASKKRIDILITVS